MRLEIMKVLLKLADTFFLAPSSYGHATALAFLYLLCPLPVMKLGLYFSDRWHILSSFRVEPFGTILSLF